MSSLPKGWYHKVAQNRRQHRVLELLNFWWPKANPRYDGHRWLVWSMEEWATHIGGEVSDKTVRRMLKTLEANGIIATRLGKHPYVFGTKPALWVRPDPLGIRAFLTGNVTANMTGNVTGTILQLNSETAEQLESIDLADPHGPQSTEAQMTKSTGADFLLNKKKGATIASALGSLGGGQKGPKDFPMVKTAQQAHDCLVAACRAGGYPNPGALTMKRSGQMKVMLKRLMEELDPAAPAAVGQLIFFVCSKWPEFQGWTKTKFNAIVGGTAPNHAALTMYAVEAVGFWQSYTASSTVQEKPSAGSSNFDDDF